MAFRSISDSILVGTFCVFVSLALSTAQNVLYGQEASHSSLTSDAAEDTDLLTHSSTSFPGDAQLDSGYLPTRFYDRVGLASMWFDQHFPRQEKWQFEAQLLSGYRNGGLLESRAEMDWDHRFREAGGFHVSASKLADPTGDNSWGWDQ